MRGRLLQSAAAAERLFPAIIIIINQSRLYRLDTLKEEVNRIKIHYLNIPKILCKKQLLSHTQTLLLSHILEALIRASIIRSHKKERKHTS